jgi:putative inorganic carbon (HCO3(-)) transporter
MTSSRGAILGLIASLLFIFFVRRNKKTNLILLLIILILLTLPQIRNFLGYIYAGIVDESRIIIWLNSLELIKIFPFTGVGLGNFKIAYSLYFGEEMMHAHNIYLNTAAELGLPGFIMLVILSVQIIAFGIIFTKQKEDKFYYALNLGLTSMAFGFIIRCLTDFTL